MGRYSFLGKDPFLILRSRAARQPSIAWEKRRARKPFIASVRELMADSTRHSCPACRASPVAPSDTSPTMPRPGSSPVTLQATTDSDEEAGFMLFDTVLAFDHVRHRILIIANARITGDEDLESLYQFALRRSSLSSASSSARFRAPRSPIPRSSTSPRTSAASSSSRWCALRRSIAAGDIYQVVLSQRFEASIATDPFTVYRALRHVNPSPYMYFLRIGGRSIVGHRLRCWCAEGRRVETPIAGTPRRNDEEDLRLAEELKRNEKERPSTSCSSILGATTSVASPNTAAFACPHT